MGGHCSGVSHKLGDWTTPPGTTRRKLEPGGGTLSQRRHPLRKCLHSSPPADFPGARESKNLPGEEQTPPLPFRQLMGTFTDAVSQLLPRGSSSTAPRPSARAAVAPADRLTQESRQHVTRLRASRNPPPGKRVLTPRDRKNFAPPPQ